MSASRSDGYTDALNVFQGVRAYDPNSAQWTSPDAYSGDVHDPMSQKPYMWNNNNGVAYADPSGYCADPAPGQPPNGCLGGVDWNLNMKAANAMQKILNVAVMAIAWPERAAEGLYAVTQALNGTSKVRVLGGFSAYIDTAYIIGGRAWHMAVRTWAALSPAAREALNDAFLDDGIKEGAEFQLAPGKWGASTQHEIEYLMDHGYTAEENNGVWTLRPRNASSASSLFYDSNTMRPL